MSFLVWNIVFAGVWLALSGAFTLPNFILGFVFGAASLYFIRDDIRVQSSAALFFRRPFRILSLVCLFAYELIKAALSVASIVLRPKMDLKPGIFAYQTNLTKDNHVTLLAHLITLTPGTLTVDVSDDKRVLYIHALDCSDIEATRADIRNGFELKIKEAFGDLI